MIPLGIIWAGYTLVWYGWSLLKDWNIGITDLLKPSSVSLVSSAITGPPSNTNGNAPNTPAQSAGNHGAIFGVGGPVTPQSNLPSTSAQSGGNHGAYFGVGGPVP